MLLFSQQAQWQAISLCFQILGYFLDFPPKVLLWIRLWWHEWYVACDNRWLRVTYWIISSTMATSLLLDVISPFTHVFLCTMRCCVWPRNWELRTFIKKLNRWWYWHETGAKRKLNIHSITLTRFLVSLLDILACMCKFVPLLAKNVKKIKFSN